MYKIRRPQAYSVVSAFFLIQLLISRFIPSGFLKVNLMIIIAAFFALFSDENFGFEIGLVSGLLMDIFSIRLFGLNAVLMALGGYLVGKYHKKFYRESIITHAIINFSITLFVLSIYYLFVSSRTQPETQWFSLRLIISPAVIAPSLINSFLGLFIYAYLIRVFRLGEIFS